MTDDPAQSVQAEWARWLAAGFVAAGVRQVVVSPGSRSTPFLCALAEEPSLVLADVIDERTAAFYALGVARASGEPALLLCTSGTAAAHYLPAVIEASESRTPLLILTADRPLELQDCGAPQTIDQVRLFGHHVRAFHELGAARGSDRALLAVRRKVVQAVATSQTPRPGPVHLNARARKPLEPLSTAGSALEPKDEAPRFFAAAHTTTAAAVRWLVERCQRAERGLLVAGSACLSSHPAHGGAVADAVARFQERTGFVVAADLSSQLPYSGRLSEVPRLSRWIGAALEGDGLRPDLILQLGSAPLSNRWSELVDRAGTELIVLSPYTWPDPTSRAIAVLEGPIADALDGVVSGLSETPIADSQRAFRGQLGAEETRIEEAIFEALVGQVLTEGKVVRRAIEALQEGSLLGLGNSLPIRLAETWGPPTAAPLRIMSQRGASGIDGLISGFAGSVTVLQEHGVHCPSALLLLGDLSFLHDLGGLRLAAKVSLPTVLVVLNNQGGRIFEQLPVATDRPGGVSLDHWVTPHSMSFRGAADQFSLAYQRVTEVAELDAALTAALRHRGASIVEAVLPPHGAAADNEQLRQAIARRRQARG